MLTAKELMDELQRLLDTSVIDGDTPVMVFNDYWDTHQRLSLIAREIITTYQDYSGVKFATQPTKIISFYDE